MSEDSPKKMSLSYSTDYGSMYCGLAEDVLVSPDLASRKGKVQLILTSPPFPLNRKKKYGNYQGDEYVKWLSGFVPIFRELLAEDGSVVMELGNAWEPGRPVMSTLALEALLGFSKPKAFNVCQQFICYNPARLPSPIQWVNVERIRVKDAYTHVWWFSKSERPKADNRRVLKEYSQSMVKLLAVQKYNAGKRPSEHAIGKTSFLTNNRGSIPSNVLTIANTGSNDEYQKYCRAKKVKIHPARMPTKLAEFFIKFLTEENDLILDPFAGSNVTGATAEKLKRKWISVEPNEDYIVGSRGRLSMDKEESINANSTIV